MSHKGIFEDSDDFSESGEDFSASEDDWVPGKNDKPSDDEEDDVSEDATDDEDDDDNQPKSKKRQKSKITKVPKLGTSRRQTGTLRSKLFRRYNPPPKNGPKSPVPAKVAEILSGSQYKKRHQMPSTSTSTSGSAQASVMQSDSESSEDEGLVNPNEIDFNSEFFDVKANKQENQQQQQQDSAPVFDCNAGMNLTDSSDEDDDKEFSEVAAETNDEPVKKPSIVDRINKKSSKEVHDFSSLHTFAKNLESAKAQLAMLKEKEASTSKANTDESDITKLLSLGEGMASISTPSRKRKNKVDKHHSDDSEWENVSDDDGHANEIKDIQITVGNEAVRGMTRDQKRAIDLEACLKRRLNREIKEKQVYLHKTAVLCWISHGNYINRVLNNMKLMEMCLKLLPSKNAYPKGDTDIKYYNMVTEWFNSVFDLKSNKQYCDLKRLPPKTQSLALQIQSKKIISKYDFVLLFVTMLRSLGLQCRLVINFAVPPLRPPQKDLFVVSSKPKDAADSKSDETTKSESKSLAKKIKASTEKMKVPFKEEKKSIKIKEPEKVSPTRIKSSQSSRSKSQAKPDHSYAEQSTAKKIKVKVSQMSQSFIEEKTAEPTSKRAHKKPSTNSKHSPHSSPSKSHSSPSKSTKIESNKLKQEIPESPKMNAKPVKSNENGNAASSQGNIKKHGQSVKSNQVMIGTPTKHKLAKRTNGTDTIALKDKQIKKATVPTTTAYSPRKTRSKSVRNGEATDVSKAKTKLKLPQLDGGDDIPTKKKTNVLTMAKQIDRGLFSSMVNSKKPTELSSSGRPSGGKRSDFLKKLDAFSNTNSNVEKAVTTKNLKPIPPKNLNINVAALLSGAKPAKSNKKSESSSKESADTVGDDAPAKIFTIPTNTSVDNVDASGRLTNLNRDRAKNPARRPPTRAGRKQYGQESLPIAQVKPVSEMVEEKENSVDGISSCSSKIEPELIKSRRQAMPDHSYAEQPPLKKFKVKPIQPKNLNIGNIDINVAALLPGAKPAKSNKKSEGSSKESADTVGDDAPAKIFTIPTNTSVDNVDAFGRLSNLNRDRAKNPARRPPTRAGRKQFGQESLPIAQVKPVSELVEEKGNSVDGIPSCSSKIEPELIKSKRQAKSDHSYAEQPPHKKVKVHLWRMSESFIEEKTEVPRSKRVHKKSTTTFSPRKTRSVRNGEVTDVSKAKTKLKIPQLDGADDKPTKKKPKATVKPRPKQSDGSNSDSDFAPSPPKRVRAKITPKKLVNKVLARAKQIDRRVFSTDEEIEDDSNAVNRMNFWVEAYAEKEKKWVVIDPVKKKVDCADHVRKNASKPIIYVLAWNNDNTIRDVTPRYCSQFHTTTRKLRAEQLWIDEALDKFYENRNPRTIIEDVEFSKMHMDTPMPKSVGEFKNHPLYALERHLLKFEAIYPANALTMGYIRNEPIFARECVHTLHSRELWVKQARTVKVGEKPYKIVKARPKWNRMLNQMEEAKPLEIFGFWQTEAYKPPVAENGMVPRNPYGNVELFKPEMLPIGTRHIQLPNLNRVCKKLNVDCAQAVIGFDFHGGSSHPTFDGFVVCEEFADDVIKQWEIDQEEQIRKETQKREARVYGNWKKLIKGLLIRERLKRKFNFGVDENADKTQGKKRKKD